MNHISIITFFCWQQKSGEGGTRAESEGLPSYAADINTPALKGSTLEGSSPRARANINDL